MAATSTRKNPKRVAAAKKAARTRARNRRAGSSSRGRRRRPRKKTMSEQLSEQFSLSKKDSIMNIGIAGGTAGLAVATLTDYEPDAKRQDLYIFGGAILAAWAGYKNIAAALMGIGVYRVAVRAPEASMQEGGNHQWFDPSELDEGEAMYLDVNGRPMTLNENGDFELSERDEFNLSENGYIPGYFGTYYTE